MRNLRTFAHDESGATAVEFALILPLLLSIVFGIICFGQFFAIANSLQQLSAEAARASVAEITMVDREATARDFIDNAGERFSFLGGGNIDPTVTPFEDPPAIMISLEYNLAGSAVEIASDFLGLDIGSITRSSYLAY